MLKSIGVRETDKIIFVDIPDPVIKEARYDLINEALLKEIGKNKSIGINLKEIEYCNSRFISILLTVAKQLHGRSQELYLIAPREMVEGLLYVNGLDRIVDIVDDESKIQIGPV